MSGNDNSSDGLWMLFFILFITFGILFMIWYTFTPYVVQGYLWLRQGEVMIGSLWTDTDASLMTSMGPMTFAQAKDIVFNATPQQILESKEHWSVMEATSRVILTPLKIPVGILFGIMALWALFKSPTSQHRKTYGLDSLMKAQVQTFPVISPIINFNPLKDVKHRAPGALVPAELPLFAEALSPEEWIAFYKIPIPDGQVDKEAMTTAFALQLGKPWLGYKKLAPYEQVLLATFAMRASRKRVESDAMLGEIAQSWQAKGGLKLSGALVSKARSILKNKQLSEGTIAECNRHGFVTTALLGALENARSEGGVLAPAQFLWLRGHDRTLWYPLNNLGRQAFHAEALGAMSHYRSERQVQRPVPKPMLKDAVDVLAAYIGNKDKSMPIPQLDFSMIKNKKAPNKNEGVMKPAGT